MQIDIKEVNVTGCTQTPNFCLRVRLAYKNQSALENKPYLFILPGGPGANHSYYLNYDCLAEFANLIYYDPRGCGLSDEGNPLTYNLNNHINDIHTIKESLQLESFALLGKSYGAICALGYTLRYPKGVHKLILAAGVPTHEFMETAKSNLFSRGTKEQQRACQSLWKGDIKNDEQMNEYIKIMASMYSWKQRNNQPINRIKPTHRFSHESFNEGFSKRFGQFDYTSSLGNIQCPTLIMVGEEDWITSPPYSKIIAEKIPKSTLHIFKNSDHAMESDVPELFFNTIINFMTYSECAINA